MFGYVVIDRPELKCREYDEYKGFYCGLCKALAKEHGFFARLCVSYDLTFLSILYAGLYESGRCESCEHCIIHPIEKRCIVRHDYEDYCADMTVFLTWLKCMDDWKDEKKIGKRIYACFIGRRARKVREKYKEKCESISLLMEELSEKEKNNEKNPDVVSGLFGKLLAEIFAMKQDRWEPLLRNMGFYLGKFIYILDAYDDLEKDKAKNAYNPLIEISEREDFDEYIKELLTFMIAECCKNYHMLPVVEHEAILGNILYSGVWTGYNKALDKKREKNNKSQKE
ncbi:MAG: DUF5685 family protein [Lachnospiraceae bacterium]